MGPIVSWDIFWPGVVVLSVVGLCGSCALSPLKQDAQVIISWSVILSSVRTGNVLFLDTF